MHYLRNIYLLVNFIKVMLGIDIKKPYKQPQPDHCVPCCIKIMLDNQFTSTNNPSLSKISSMCKYRNAFGTSVDRLKSNLKDLESLRIKFNEKEESNIAFLEELLKNKCLPMILLDLDKYLLKRDGNTIIRSDDDIIFHAVVVAFIDKQNEKIFIFDPLHNKYKKSKIDDKLNIYEELSYQELYDLWVNEALIYPVYWFTKIQNKLDKFQKRLPNE